MKRIICVMLTLIMLVSLVPMTALTASAASYATSEAAITVLKKMTTYKEFCYRVADTQEFRIGYGTVCEKDHQIDSKLDGTGSTVVGDPHRITEKEADTALRKALSELDKKVNAFASSNSLTLKQNQHDALVVFSYGVGTAWMNGTSAVKTAIVNNAGVNEMLKAMRGLAGDMDRHKVEVNMYYNNVYSNVVPSTFGEVTYDPNGGTMAQGYGYNMFFDTTATTNHISAPLRSGYVFLGWYYGRTNGEWAPKLTGDCNGETLYAYWQQNNVTPSNASNNAVRVHYTLSSSSLASHALFTRPDVDYNDGDRELEVSSVDVSRDFIDVDGTRWAQVTVTINNRSAQRWVIVSYGSGAHYNGGIDIDVTVTVTNNTLNRRVNASTASAINGSYRKGDKVRIISTENGSGLLWGQVAADYDDNTPVGWIALMYTNWNSVKDDPESTRDPQQNQSKVIALATVTFDGYVNLRSEAGTDSKIVGSLYKNDTVEIYEIKTVNGHQWGRTNGGWLCLTYTSLLMQNGYTEQDISNEGLLNYTFTGEMTARYTPKVSPSRDAADVESRYTVRDEDNDNKVIGYADLLPHQGDAVKISNMVVSRDGKLWARISWRVDMNLDDVDDTTKYGWVELSGNVPNGNLTTSSSPVAMDATKFTAVTSDITVREKPDSGAEPIAITLNKGFEIEIHEIRLVGENIWGRLTNEHVVTGDFGGANFDGWVNLATKYFTRSNLPVVEEDEGLKPIGLIAKVVGATSVNVRITGSATATKVGTLSMGTVANVLEVSEDEGWYNLDIDVDGNPETGSWVSVKYLQISEGYVNGAGPDSGSNNKPAPTVTGKGVVANTYAGVNVRKGAGTGYAFVAKLLPGTMVDILEITEAGNTKWGRIAQGWVCMDYITMVSQEIVYPESPVTPDGSTKVDSYEELDKTTTTAIYTGTISGARYDSTPIFSEPSHQYVDDNGDALDTSFVTRVAKPGEKVTVYELLAVKEMHLEGEDGHPNADESNGGGHGTSVEVIETSYWARVNDGYIFNPQDHIDLDALDEKVHTVAGIESLNIRDDANGNTMGDALKQGTQVKITALKIVQDKVWGRTDIERNGTLGWIRLDYAAEGAYVVEEKPTTAPTQPQGPILGSDGNTSGGGIVNNTSGYRYTGTIVGSNTVNVRSTPSTDGKLTTTLKNGAALVIYETRNVGGMAWGRCDAGWVYLYYVDLTPVVSGPVDTRVTGNSENTIIYTDSAKSGTAGTYSRQSVVDIYEVVGNMSRTEQGWVDNTDFLR